MQNYRVNKYPNKSARGVRQNMEFSILRLHVVHLNLRLFTIVIRLKLVPNRWTSGCLSLITQ